MPEPNTKPVIFLAFANDRKADGQYLRNLGSEAEALRNTLTSLATGTDPKWELVERPSATAAQIVDVFRMYKDRIALFHYAGHADDYKLLLETAQGGTFTAEASDLAAILQRQNGLHLVFLNACSTRAQVNELRNAGVKVVVATSKAVDDELATRFATQFYQSLADGKGIGDAFAAAQANTKLITGDLTRQLRPPDLQEDHATSTWPWAVYGNDADLTAESWTLALVVNDPLFGLPPLPQLDLPETPYRHLEWFRREDAEIFFGRGHEIANLYQRATVSGGNPIILFYGQSGVGKSSVLAAGLLPRLEQKQRVAYQRRDQAKGLVGTLATALEAADGDSLADTWHAAEVPDTPLTVILDQVEELFTRPNTDLPNEMESFLATLNNLFADPVQRPKGRLILSFRKEWLAEIEARLKEHALPWAELFLEPLDQAGIVEAIAGPARVPRLRDHYGLSVADKLPGLIADDLLDDRESPVAPMLQILLTDLWKAAKCKSYAHPCLSQDLYHELRTKDDELPTKGLGLDAFLQRQLDALRVQQAEVVDSGLALDLLAYHTTPLGTAEQRKREDLKKTYSNQQEEVLGDLMQACRDLYLLVDPSTNHPGPMMDPSNNKPELPAASRLTHDTLAPHVRRRFEESDAPGQRAWRILKDRAVEWQNGKEGTPLDDADLAVVEAGEPGMRSRENAQRRLVEASRTARENRERRNRLLMFAGIMAGLVILVISVFAVWQSQISQTAQERERQAVAAQATEQVLRGEADVARAAAVANEETARKAEGEAVAAKAEVERLTRGIRADQLTANALKMMDDNPPLALLLAAEGLRTQNDITQTYMITRITYDFDQARYLTTHTQITSGETVVASAQANMHALLGGIGNTVLIGHEGSINATAFSPDGQWLATAAEDGAVRLWDVTSPHNTPIMLAGHVGAVKAVAFSPDGRWLASASNDKTARLWDVRNSQRTPIVLAGHEGFVKAVAFSPNSRWLATASVDKTARLWDVTNSQRPPIVLAGHDGPLYAMAFSADGRWLATAGEDETVRLWDVTNPHVAPIVLAGHDGSIYAMAFSADGRWLATAGEDETVRLWDVTNPHTTPIMLAGHDGSIYAMAFSPDGRWLASAGFNAHLWDVANPGTDPIMLVAEDSAYVNGVAFSPDGRWLATAGLTAYLWDVANHGIDPVKLAGHAGRANAVTFSPDSRWLATASDDQLQTFSGDPRIAIYDSANATVRLWDVVNPNADSIMLDSHGGIIKVMAFSPNGRWLATASDDKIVLLWNMAQLDPTPIILGGQEGTVLTIAFSSDSQWLAVIDDKTIRLWDMAHPIAAPIILAGHARPVSAIAFSPDGRWLATGSEDATVRLWDMAKRSSAPIVLAGHNGSVDEVSFSPDGRWLATNDSDAVRLWDMANLRVASIVATDHERIVKNVTFSPDGHWLAINDSDAVRLWDMANLRAAPIVLGNSAGSRSMAFSPDGQWLSSTARGRAGRLWDMANPSTDPIILTPDFVSTVAFSADSRWLATIDSSLYDDIVELRNVANPIGDPIVLTLHARDVVFDPDGRWLATTSGSTIWLWNWRIADLITVACRTAGRNLSQEEWQRYFRDKPYRKTCEQWPVHLTVSASVAEEASTPTGE